MSLGSSMERTIEEVRRVALSIRADASRGYDPAAERMERRKEFTVAALIDLYVTDGCYVLKGPRQGRAIKPATKQQIVTVLHHHVQPQIGNRKLSDVTTADIERLYRAVAGGKTGKERQKGQIGRNVRGGELAAVKTIRILAAMFEFAIRRNMMAANPCRLANVRRGDNRRERYLSLTEIGALGRAIAELETTGKINPKAANIIRLLLLTGCRRSEINRLRWNEIDFPGNRLVLADTKTGRSVRPLATAAATLLASLPSTEGSPFVFPSDNGESAYGGLQKAWARVTAMAGIADASLHTLRHSVGSSAVSAGETLVATGAILGHGNQRSTEIYAHFQREPAQRAADRAINPIAAALEGKPGAEVVALRK